MNNTYKQSPASAFYGAATKAPASERLTIWAFCECCMDRTTQALVEVVGKWEVYQCGCGQLKRYAVR